MIEKYAKKFIRSYRIIHLLRILFESSGNISLILLFSTITIAQTHYPLQVGNSWQYYADGDSTWVVRRWIAGDTIMPNGKSYAIMLYHQQSYPYSPTFLREDSVRVYQFYDTAEYIIYDFSKTHAGDTVSILPWGEAVRFGGIHTETVLGITKNIYVYDRPFSSEWIADSLGLIRYTGEIAYEEDIYGASVNGATYGVLTLVNQSSAQAPETFHLEQNFPNPYNPTTTISFSLPKSSIVTIKIYNILGQLISTLVNERRSPGTYSVQFDASNLPSGVYYYRLSAGDYVDTKKLLVIK